MFKLKWPRHPSPFWFGAGRHVHIGTVRCDGLVDAESDRLELLEGDLPALGTELRISKHKQYLVAETVTEYAERVEREQVAARAEAKARQDSYEQQYRDRQIRSQKDADEANAWLRIPVRWTSGLKTVLSGLSANSSGTGDNSRSVTHILLLESVEENGFRRPARTFLCTSTGNTNGQAWTGSLQDHSVGVNGPYVSKITCKQCLKLARRWESIADAKEPTINL